MENPSAFIGRKERPTEQEILSVLGASAVPWKELLAWLSNELQVTNHEWKCYSQKSGWSLQLKKKKRTIIHAFPCNGFFQLAFIFGDKAVATARQSKLSQKILKIIEEAPRYTEGTGIRIKIKSSRDLPPIYALAKIKLEN